MRPFARARASPRRARSVPHRLDAALVPFAARVAGARQYVMGSYNVEKRYARLWDDAGVADAKEAASVTHRARARAVPADSEAGPAVVARAAGLRPRADPPAVLVVSDQGVEAHRC